MPSWGGYGRRLGRLEGETSCQHLDAQLALLSAVAGNVDEAEERGATHANEAPSHVRCASCNASVSKVSLSFVDYVVGAADAGAGEG
jgi:hypothetical protein